MHIFKVVDSSSGCPMRKKIMSLNDHFYSNVSVQGLVGNNDSKIHSLIDIIFNNV